MVTAETAVMLPALAGLLAVLLSVLGQGLDTVRATDAARSAARLVARGEGIDTVRLAALREAPDGATFTASLDDGMVTVAVTAPGRLLLPGVHLPSVSATATVAAEPTTSVVWP